MYFMGDDVDYFLNLSKIPLAIGVHDTRAPESRFIIITHYNRKWLQTHLNETSPQFSWWKFNEIVWAFEKFSLSPLHPSESRR